MTLRCPPFTPFSALQFLSHLLIFRSPSPVIPHFSLLSVRLSFPLPISLFLASLQSHKIWSWLSIYSAHGSVAMTTKLEARAPGSYFWSSAVMLDTAFSPALCLSVFLSLSHYLSVGFSDSLSLHCCLSLSLSLSISFCLIKDRLVKAASLSSPSVVSDG